VPDWRNLLPLGTVFSGLLVGNREGKRGMRKVGGSKEEVGVGICLFVVHRGAKSCRSERDIDVPEGERRQGDS
jgi:hypothetical protein